MLRKILRWGLVAKAITAIMELIAKLRAYWRNRNQPPTSGTSAAH
jgi:hypothetical protein